VSCELFSYEHMHTLVDDCQADRGEVSTMASAKVIARKRKKVRRASGFPKRGGTYPGL